jgi:hypothetical protein
MWSYRNNMEASAMRRTWKEWLLLAIALITILSAFLQIVGTESALNFMGVSISAESIYLFRLVSLLTGLFGGALLHTLLSDAPEPVVLLWVGLQKVLSSLAVLLAVLNQLLTGTTLLVAGYDFLAGLFVLWYRLMISRR